MKIQQKLAAVLTVLLMIPNGFPALNVKAGSFPEETGAAQGTVSSSDPGVSVTTPTEAPGFSACIEFSPQGYVVMGTFTEFLPDLDLVQPLASLDGESWWACERTWELNWMDIGDAEALKKMQTQVCIRANQEPLRSYLAGELDCFYVKLRVTRDKGTTYETQAVMIERGAPSPLPEELIPIAMLDQSILIRKWRPYTEYGKYQLTISADAAPEDITAFLPDTLPIRIDLQRGIDYVTGGIVECPVTWKPLTLPELTAGESVIIQDAAEEIVVPEGALLNTPMGIFQLNESLRIDQFSHSDEIRLVLNVAAEDKNPTGVLRMERDGLQMAFELKPTGAAAIRAYVFSDGDSQWEELSDLPILEAVNAQPSAANSGYTVVLDDTSELLQSYLAAEASGEEPVPFYVGLKIEGGVYDSRQLVLAWPDTYKAPSSLPDIGGSGGNEGNAGADNKGDSTEGGQRPNLPDSPEQPQNPEEGSDMPGGPEQSRDPEEGSDMPGGPEQPQDPEEGSDMSGSPEQPRDAEDGSDMPGSPVQPRNPEEGSDMSGSPEQPRNPENESDMSFVDKVSQDRQDPGNGHLLEGMDVPEQHAEAQTATDIDAGKIYPPIVPPINPKTDIQTLEKIDSSTGMNGRKYVLIVTGIAIAGICIIIIAGRKKV